MRVPLSIALAAALLAWTAPGAAQPLKGVRPLPTAQPFADGFLAVLVSDLSNPRRKLTDWSLRRPDSRSSFNLVSVVVPKSRAWVSVRAVDRNGPARSVYVQGPCQDAVAVVNGSFFYEDERGARPMGLVRIDGRTVQEPSPRRSGGFLLSDGRSLRIVPKAQPAAALKARFAVESSPILILDGRSGMRSNDGRRYDRVAVGLTADGDLVAVGAFGPSQNAVSLWEFERLAREAARRHGETLRHLIAMDGGPSAHLYQPNGGKGGALRGHLGPIYTPNVVCLGVR